MRKIDAINCYSPTREKREAFCADMSKRCGVAVRAVDTPEAAVQGADIVLCATNASEHVFRERWLEPGMYVCTIRGPELEPGVVRQADIVAVNDRVAHANVKTTGGIAIPANRHAIAGLDPTTATSLADLIAGIAPGRTAAAQKTCFVNLPGIGLQFAAVGAAFYRKARDAGRGRELPTEWFTEDVVP